MTKILKRGRTAMPELANAAAPEAAAAEQASAASNNISIPAERPVRAGLRIRRTEMMSLGNGDRLTEESMQLNIAEGVLNNRRACKDSAVNAEPAEARNEQQQAIVGRGRGGECGRGRGGECGRGRGGECGRGRGRGREHPYNLR